MSPDDPTGTRELRFSYGNRHFVIIHASRDGSGDISVTDDLMQPAEPDIALAATRDAVRMLSIARHIAFEDFRRRGGTVEDLREDGDSEIS